MSGGINNIPVYEFYYDFFIEDDTLTEILNFFEKINANVNVGDGLHSLAGNIKKQTQIKVKIPSDIIINFSTIYKTTQKYNL